MSHSSFPAPSESHCSQYQLFSSSAQKSRKELDALVSSVSISEKLFLRGDLNEHICSSRVGFDEMHMSFAYVNRNQEGEGILISNLAYDLIIANTLFERVSHIVTFSSGQHCSQIDFILVRREDIHACLDCKVILGECVVTQYKLVVADFCFSVRLQRSKRVQTPRTKWWKLKVGTTKTFKKRVLRDDPWHEGGDANSM
jgi:hypothetical protein